MEKGHEELGENLNDKIPSGDMEGQTEVVKYETYKRTLAQAKKAKQQADELQERLAAYEQKEAEAEEKRLREQGELKKILELKEKKLAEREAEVKQLSTQWDEAIKFAALRERLPGPLVDDEAYEIVRRRLDNIAIDPESGRVVEETVKEVADLLTQEKQWLFKSTNAKLPSNAPKGSASPLTVEAWQKLPLKERKDRMSDVFKANT